MTKEQLKKEIDGLSEEQWQKVDALMKEILGETQEKKLQNFIHAVDQHPIKTDKISIPNREARNSKITELTSYTKSAGSDGLIPATVKALRIIE